ncbi:hypothetical protein A5733_04355 [Mycobacterium sp. NS-7484]|uniref:hypothetical protein n=1 Tax=Mycobacterium sp. NS-7484 TaxID=1834161 RepID=UPI00096FBC12|nr:hypothetical protein [Mycobacterium sp. NS-7484]OMC00349.1 hypothetical protein A5733_04355 [Mycobacterium sp. NS-7484]
MSEHSPPPEAELIERLRAEIRPPLSARAAARAAGISEGRWRQIVKGYNKATSDVRVPVIAPAETLARMAKAVGAGPEQLSEVGREDAADELLLIYARGKVDIEQSTSADDDWKRVQQTAATLAIELLSLSVGRDSKTPNELAEDAHRLYSDLVALQERVAESAHAVGGPGTGPLVTSKGSFTAAPSVEDMTEIQEDMDSRAQRHGS